LVVGVAGFVKSVTANWLLVLLPATTTLGMSYLRSKRGRRDVSGFAGFARRADGGCP
jgi:hypothetical protein